MHSFLYNVAKTYYENIVNNNDNDIRFSDIAFIFPNKRSGLFFKKELKNIATQNIFLPQIFDINSIVLKNSNKVIASDIELLLTLYEAYSEIKGEENKIEELHKFTNLGFSLIKDFDEIDKYLIDTDIFFKNIEDLQDLKKVDYLSEEQKKAIKNFFNFDTDKEINKNYFSLWKILNELYNNYKNRLRVAGKAYYGMLFRDYVENLKSPIFNDTLLSEYKRVVFVGFNFLTKSEEEIFKFFNNNKIGDYYFDYPEIYKQQDFFNTTITINYDKNTKLFKSRYHFDQESDTRFPSIDVYNTSTQSGQIHIANQLLSNIEQENESDLSDTAVLLPNEGILTSLLEYIPIDLKRLNITMGYPLDISILSGLINDITSMQLNVREDERTKEISYNYKEVMSIISNQYIKQNATDICNRLTSGILRNNYIWITKNNIKELTKGLAENSLITKLFLLDNEPEKICSTKEFTDYIHNIIDILLSLYEEFEENVDEKSDTVSDVTAHSQYENIDSNFLTQYQMYLNQLNDYIKDFEGEIDLKTFCSFLSHLTSNLKVQLYGEPLKGLQIMGMLESRLIDFKNMIIIGFNDENLPGITTSSSSIIPYILRKAYNLPTFEQHNAIYAYNFFRTIYRADKVSCIYNSEAAISQYYYIFKYIIPQIYNKFELRHFSEKTTTITNTTGISTEDNNITIKKNEDIRAELALYTTDDSNKKELSPSALKKFISCPLKFYFSYLLKLKETDEISEIIDSADFGLVFHKVMELYYTEYKDEKKDIKDICREEFLSAIQATDEEGKKLYNKIILSLLNNFLISTLKYDKSRNFEFSAAEKDIFFKVDNVNFKGIIDRIDIDNDEKIINIIDYKTSRPSKQTEIQFTDLFTHNTSGQEVLQVLMYCKAVSESADFCKSIGVNNSYEYKIHPMIYKIYDIYNDDSKHEAIREQDITVTIPNKIEEKIQDIFPDDELSAKEIIQLFKLEEVDLLTSEDFIVKDYRTWRYREAFEYFLNKTVGNIFRGDEFAPYDKKRRDCTFCPFIHICRKESEVSI